MRRRSRSSPRSKLAVDFHPLDVTDGKSIETLRDFLKETYGHLDVLINNAGIIAKGEAPALKVDLATVRATLETNALGPLHLAQTLVPLLKRGSQAAHRQHVERHGRADRQ